MSKFLLVSFFILLIRLIFSGFTLKVEAQKLPPQKLQIELGKHFQEDRVKIYLDKKLVYNKQITTADSTKATDVFTVTKPKKPFVITVEVNGEKFEKSSPKQTKELNKEDYSLLIDYNRKAEEVEIKTKTVIILYD